MLSETQTESCPAAVTHNKPRSTRERERHTHTHTPATIRRNTTLFWSVIIFTDLSKDTEEPHSPSGYFKQSEENKRFALMTHRDKQHTHTETDTTHAHTHAHTPPHNAHTPQLTTPHTHHTHTQHTTHTHTHTHRENTHTHTHTHTHTQYQLFK